MAAAVFETHMLPDPGRRRRDMQLFTDVFADTMQRALTAGTRLPVFREIIFDTLARQVGRQGLASAFLCHRRRRLWQARIGQHDGIDLRLRAHLLGFVEHPLAALLAAGRKALELRQAELLLELAHARRQLRVARFQVADVSLHFRRQVGERGRFVHACNDTDYGGRTGLRKIVTMRKMSVRRHRRQCLLSGVLVLPRRMALHGIDVDAVE